MTIKEIIEKYGWQPGATSLKVDVRKQLAKDLASLSLPSARKVVKEPEEEVLYDVQTLSKKVVFSGAYISCLNHMKTNILKLEEVEGEQDVFCVKNAKGEIAHQGNRMSCLSYIRINKWYLVLKVKEEQ